jgi:hypothetical protein
MLSIPFSRSVAGTIYEHVGHSDQGNGRHAAGFPSQCQPPFFPSITDEHRVTSHQEDGRGLDLDAKGC